MKLGLSEKQANSIKSYEAKGGKFRSKADVKKMFVISAEKFEELEPYIQILQNETSNKIYKQVNERKNRYNSKKIKHRST